MKRLLFITTFILCSFGILVAQTTNSAPILNPDEKIAGLFSKFSYWQFLLIPIITALISGLRQLVPKIPSAMLPWLAPFIGAILDWAAMKSGIWTGGNVAIGLLLGTSATWFHQIGKQTMSNQGSTETETTTKTTTPPPVA